MMVDVERRIIFGPADYTVHVSLRGVRPVVWRRLVVSSDLMLPLFARALETAMGWQGYHLHLFAVGGIDFSAPDDEDDTMVDETGVLIKQVLRAVGDGLRFDYDFGDGWEHDVRVESAAERDFFGPQVLGLVDGAGACPPEDVGGVSGYEHLVEVLADPKHPDYRELRTWAGRGFHPSVFDLTKTQRKVTGLLKPVRRPKSALLGVGGSLVSRVEQ